LVFIVCRFFDRKRKTIAQGLLLKVKVKPTGVLDQSLGLNGGVAVGLK
jgi:hypothetical protein